MQFIEYSPANFVSLWKEAMGETVSLNGANEATVKESLLSKIPNSSEHVYVTKFAIVCYTEDLFRLVSYFPGTVSILPCSRYPGNFFVTLTASKRQWKVYDDLPTNCKPS